MPEPEPLVPSDYDVSSLSDFRLDVDRLLVSELVAIGTPEECWAALMLWCRAWKQVPGGSLPNDDRILAAFSGAGKRWPKVRDVALHGFVLCSDGRLYHRFLCEEVKRAYKSRTASETRRDADRKRLQEWREKRARNISETRFVAEVPVPEPEPEPQISKSSVPNGTDAAAPPDDPIKALFDRGVAILGAGSRSLIGKARRDYGDLCVMAAIAACENEKPSDPASFFVKCLSRNAVRSPGNGRILPNEGVF